MLRERFLSSEKGLDEYPYYSDMYKDSSNTDEITDDDDFAAGGSAEGSAYGRADKNGHDNGSSNLSEMDIGSDGFVNALEDRLHNIIAKQTEKFKQNFKRHRA